MLCFCLSGSSFFFVRARVSRYVNEISALLNQNSPVDFMNAAGFLQNFCLVDFKALEWLYNRLFEQPGNSTNQNVRRRGKDKLVSTINNNVESVLTMPASLR